MGVKDLAIFAALACGLAGCTAEGRLAKVLAGAFPAGATTEIVDSCSGAFGLNPAVAVFYVIFPAETPDPDLSALTTGEGIWTRQASLQDFAETHGTPEGVSATVLDGKDCLQGLDPESVEWLFEAAPGQYYRSQDQTVVIMLPDGLHGTGVIFVQGR